ncbi:zinc ABC transporter substrate-binding protein [Candidatus Pelagibacter sp. HIMB109]|uniref:zinc ABC transporter substrate-binding protein n=1 Tax=Candidatus Pelagibacter sp. HIMB109 TaxID=3415412 RepID=UPI003F839E24
MKNQINKFFFSVFLILFLGFSHAKAELQVVTSIKPIYSLASMLMDGIGAPKLIVDGSNSPHNFTLKPSHAKMLQNADLVFWVGEDIEAFLEKPLRTVAKKAKKIELMEISQIKKIKFREKNIYKDHHDDHGHKKHDDHGHKKHDDHGHKKHDDHGHKKHDDHGHKKHDDHGHAHGEHDPHIWLDPLNAKVILNAMAKNMKIMDKKNSANYDSNLKKANAKIDGLVSEINRVINKNAKYVVFHDAYQYFERRFGLKTLGALTVNTDVLPGAEQLKDIRKVIKRENAKCIFSEPQFNPKIIKAIAKDTNIKTGVLDPLGADLKNNKDLYFQLLNNLSNSLRKC